MTSIMMRVSEDGLVDVYGRDSATNETWLIAHANGNDAPIHLSHWAKTVWSESDQRANARKINEASRVLHAVLSTDERVQR